MKLILIPILAFALCGCVTKNKQVIAKQTIFGLQVSESPTGGLYPSIQVGLVRNEYISNPTGTNISAAPLSTHVDASISPLKQTAVEDISTH